MNTADSRRKLLNFGAFQLAWFACVLGGASDRVLAGTLVVAAAIGLHLGLSIRPWREAVLVVVASAIGLFWDSLIVSLGLMSYPSGVVAAGLAPTWIVAMWALFATTLNSSLGWLRGRPLLAALMGGVGGPLAYLAGHRLGGVEMAEPLLALAAQGVGWAALMPLLTMIGARLNGFDAAVSPDVSAVRPQEVRHV
jgi:hypothetical protein